jgi:CHASE3 domain sensor protein
VADAAAVKRAQEILTRLESLLSTMTDAETGQREFTVTGDERFLEPSGPVDVPRDPLTLGRFPTW